MQAPRAQPIRSTVVILGALILGVLAITATAVFLRLTTDTTSTSGVADMLTIALVVLFVGEAPVYVVVRSKFLASVRAEREASLELVRQGLMPPALGALAIIGAALAEGAGMLGAVTLIVGGPWIVLAAPALAVVLIALQIPTRARVETLVRELG